MTDSPQDVATDTSPVPRSLVVTVCQLNPLQIDDPLDRFEEQVRTALDRYPDTELLVFPEIHLFGDGVPDQSRPEALHAAAEPLDGPRVAGLRAIAARAGVWLVPGSLCERGPQGELFNTEILLSPEGELAASYRKIFPWRPHEPYTMGDSFTVVDIPLADAGSVRAGLHICYDSWFPEVTRQLAWMGADIIVSVVKTTSPDREQELILAPANAIVNQVFNISCNVAGPTGEGRSIIVGPEGAVLAQAGVEEEILSVRLDLSEVDTARTHGTAGVNRPWKQLRADDPVVPLPIYAGRIDPATWEPEAHQ